MAKPIRSTQYETEKQEIRKLLTTQLDHPGVLEACAWFDKWMTQAISKTAPCGNYIMGRLGWQKVEPLTVLLEAMAIWLYSRRNPSILPDDNRLTYALARGVAHLLPWQVDRFPSGYKKTHYPTSEEMFKTGERIRATLGILYMNIETAFNRQAELAESFKVKQGIPFN